MSQDHEKTEAYKQKMKLIRVMDTCYSRGWSWATGGNFSFLDGKALWMSPSGAQKCGMSPEDLIKVDFDGVVLEGTGRPSAEFLIHTFLMSEFGAQSVLHTHSICGTKLSLTHDRSVFIKGFEMLKALEGVSSHEHREEIRVLKNTQDIKNLIPELKSNLNERHHAFLLSGHGLYTWGSSIDVAFRHLEALEFLFQVI